MLDRKTISLSFQEEDDDEDAKHFSIEEETGQMGVGKKNPELPACLPSVNDV